MLYEGVEALVFRDDVEICVRIVSGQLPYVVGNVEVQSARSIATDFDITTIGTERLYRIDGGEVEPFQIRADKNDDPKMLMLKFFNVLRPNVFGINQDEIGAHSGPPANGHLTD
jgi:hypothetical protein